MFAYCGNNPVMYQDRTGHSLWPTTIAVCDGGSGYPVQPVVANTPEEQTYGMVNGQAVLPYSNYSIGLGSYAKSGCGYIAVYNAMQLIGQPQSLQNVTDEIFFKRGTVCFGALGVPPWGLRRYFKAHEVDFTESYAMADITSHISEGDVVVFTVFNNRKNIFKGMHTMAALYTNNQYLVFNQYNNSKTYSICGSLEEAFPKGAWFYGIRISNN